MNILLRVLDEQRDKEIDEGEADDRRADDHGSDCDQQDCTVHADLHVEGLPHPINDFELVENSVVENFFCSQTTREDNSSNGACPNLKYHVSQRLPHSKIPMSLFLLERETRGFAG